MLLLKWKIKSYKLISFFTLVTMELEGNYNLESEIKRISEKFKEVSKEKEVLIVSHFDTDGITSAAIMVKALKRLDRCFSVEILKSLEKEFVYNLPKNKVILFLDLASNALEYLKEKEMKNIFIIDHHEVSKEIPSGVEIINTELFDKQKISASGLSYLFAKQLNPQNKDSAKLAVLGMIGDTLEKDIDKLNHGILEDADVLIKKGLLIYPSTRPINRALEYSSNPYIPGVTGDVCGVIELLRESSISPESGKYKSLLELSNEEMERLVTSVMLRCHSEKQEGIVGNIYLLKMFNKLEDARELSAKINACSRLGDSFSALLFCLENPQIKKQVDSIHIKYRQHIVSGLKYFNSSKKISGNGFVLFNAQNNIKDTIIGTITSIVSNSSLYPIGTCLASMSYSGEDKIKVSMRCVGDIGRNLHHLLSKVIEKTGGEVGGHEYACGAVISREKEDLFVESLKKDLEIEVVNVDSFIENN